jgi:hypothetical protein
VVVGGKYFLPTLECQFLNWRCAYFLFAIKLANRAGSMNAGRKCSAFAFVSKIVSTRPVIELRNRIGG